MGGKVRYREDGTPLPMIAVPVFGYKSHISIDRRFGFIRSMAVTSAKEADGRLLKRVVTTDNISGDDWADSAYRSRSNEKWLSARANAAKSSVRAHVEHVFAHQKNRFGLFIRTIGLKRAEAKLTLANLAYNFNRLIFHERRRALG
ncbi:transposase [Asticcacaulis sp.]|uniref:transposase n=1 Tax=Asticcacaulis sp. TaxID=1872648 RepID=UPI002634EDF7|nr:transposase [Asticcacaulis sp.]